MSGKNKSRQNPQPLESEGNSASSFSDSGSISSRSDDDRPRDGSQGTHDPGSN